MSRPFHETVVTQLQSILTEGNRREARFCELCNLIAVTDIPGNWDTLERMIVDGSIELCIEGDPSILAALKNVREERVRHSG